MFRTQRRLALVAGAVAMAVVATACGSSKPKAATATTVASTNAAATNAPATTATPATNAPAANAPATTAAAKADLKAALQASGSTFQKAYQDEAIVAFTKANSGVSIVYGGGGSGKGRTDLAEQTVDFAGSDSTYKDEDLAKNKGGEVLYFPVLLGPITISFNIDGVDKLQLSADTIAKIFEAQITKWNDPAIAADNPGVKLPDEAIVVAHRSDGSGTTQNFTEYLVAAAPTTWTLKSGSTVEWPANTQAGNGNAGVAQIVKETEGAIGYVDLSDAIASDLTYTSVKNKAGKFVTPTADSATAAGDGITVKDNLTFKAINADGDKSYPITAQSYVIVYAKQADKPKGEALKEYVKYLLTDGQKLLADLDFAPLPSSIQSKAVAQLDKIAVG